MIVDSHSFNITGTYCLMNCILEIVNMKAQSKLVDIAKAAMFDFELHIYEEKKV
jgi:hypothetical protein